ncbi:MAG: SDR family NAD(P)-dependent oxidoreductase [Proteobacteria bacterium]|nr:SDR family NAD(P)-dependent oxidoreductase [Pseudomonadota bacterium]HQR03822.1 SDR family NAD(P)-dependent oxidoreductase [Rhodocyclaceae bacterium]
MHIHSSSSATVAVVTGASRGIGKGVARALGATGATVYVTGRSVSGGQGTLAETAAAVDAAGGRGIAVVCDHGDEAQVRALFGQVRAEQGRLDLLVNNAAHVDPELATPGNFWEKPARLGEMIRIGLHSHYLAACHAAPLLVARRRGLIANISFYGSVCYFYGPAYGAAKAGTDKMTADMAVDLRPFDVAAVSLWPGFVATERIAPLRNGLSPAEAEARFGHFETPEFTGHVIAALLADPDRMTLTGQALIVAELAGRYGIRDAGGRQPPSYRDSLGAPHPPGTVIVR